MHKVDEVLRVPTVRVIHRVHTFCGDDGGHRDGGVLGVQTASGYGRGDTVEMVEGTEMVGTVVCTQQVVKSEETQSVGSPVHTQSAR